MDDSLRLIQYLYGESVDDPEFPRRVAEDDDLRRELDRLQQTKDALDRRSPPSPDPDVVERVVDRAADAAPASGPAPDRSARAPDRDWTRRWQNAVAALALLLAVGLGWWYVPGEDASSGPTASESAARQTESATASSAPAPNADNLPEWDDRDEVVRLHRRIELLETQSRSDAWGDDLQSAGRTRP